MNRGEIREEVQHRIVRYDQETRDLIEAWIARAIKEIESLHPFDYMKTETDSNTLTVGANQYTLPTTLVMHHPWQFMIKGISDPTTHSSPMVKVGDTEFNLTYLEPKTAGNQPEYYVLKGRTNGIGFDVYPVQSVTQTLILSGYHYTDTSVWTEISTNYLTNHHPDVVLDSVTAKAYAHFQDFAQAEAYKKMYDLQVNGDSTAGVMGIIQKEKRKHLLGRYNRIHDLMDYATGYVRKIRGMG